METFQLQSGEWSIVLFNSTTTYPVGHLFAISASLSKLSAEVKHVYSRDPTFSFDMESVVLSLMNSKHISGVNGIAAILKIKDENQKLLTIAAVVSCRPRS